MKTLLKTIFAVSVLASLNITAAHAAEQTCRTDMFGQVSCTGTYGTYRGSTDMFGTHRGTFVDRNGNRTRQTCTTDMFGTTRCRTR